METALVPRTGIRCYFLPMRAPTTPRGVVVLAFAVVRALAVVSRIRPRVTFATGGYVSVPAVIASWLLRRPIVLFLPDIVPGKAVARLAPLARRIAVANAAAVDRLPPGRAVVTGYPVRDQFRVASEEERAARRIAARQRFELPMDAAVLCVFGGSQGSRSINEALARHLPEALERCHVIHVCGEKRLHEAERAAEGLSPRHRARYRLVPYLHDDEMAAALFAADLALCRSGASTLGELPAAGLPAILVPLPNLAVHQHENAEVLAAAGAAIVLPEQDLDDRLGPVLTELLGTPSRLATMAAAARRLDRPEAAEAIARLIESVAAP